MTPFSYTSCSGRPPVINIILIIGLAVPIHGKKPICIDLGGIISCEYSTIKECLSASDALLGRNACVKLEKRRADETNNL